MNKKKYCLLSGHLTLAGWPPEQRRRQVHHLKCDSQRSSTSRAPCGASVKCSREAGHVFDSWPWHSALILCHRTGWCWGSTAGDAAKLLHHWPLLALCTDVSCTGQGPVQTLWSNVCNEARRQTHWSHQGSWQSADQFLSKSPPGLLHYASLICHTHLSYFSHAVQIHIFDSFNAHLLTEGAVLLRVFIGQIVFQMSGQFHTGSGSIADWSCLLSASMLTDEPRTRLRVDNAIMFACVIFVCARKIKTKWFKVALHRNITWFYTWY